MRKPLAAAVLISLGLGLASFVEAQSSSPGIESSISEARQKPDNSQANAELFYMIQQLQSSVRQLQGQVEEQRHLINRLQQQGRDRYVDLDQRILDLTKAVESSGPQEQVDGGAEQAATSGQVQPVRIYRTPEAEEQKVYNEIIDLIRNKKDFDAAINQLYEFIDSYPEGDLTVNAYYWLGEVYLAVPKLEQARQAFTIVATRYSDHRKAPDALYKLGVTLSRLGEASEAARRMQSVVERYPESSAAELARQFLESA